MDDLELIEESNQEQIHLFPKLFNSKSSKKPEKKKNFSHLCISFLFCFPIFKSFYIYFLEKRKGWKIHFMIDIFGFFLLALLLIYIWITFPLEEYPLYYVVGFSASL